MADNHADLILENAALRERVLQLEQQVIQLGGDPYENMDDEDEDSNPFDEQSEDEDEDVDDDDEDDEEEEREREKQALVEPIKEAAYATFLCLGTFRNTCRAFESPDFFRGAFGPFLCPHMFKTFRYDGDIKEAVNLWCSDPAAAEERYGHISKWDVSCVTNMDKLFERKIKFNDNIQAWDVSKVTHMYSMFRGAASFNQPLDAWDVSSGTDMDGMFDECPISKRNRPRGAM